MWLSVCVCARMHGWVCVVYTPTIIYASHTDTKRSGFNFSVLPVDGLDFPLLHTPQNLLRIKFKSCILRIFAKSQTFVPRKSYGDGTHNHQELSILMSIRMCVFVLHNNNDQLLTFRANRRAATPSGKQRKIVSTAMQIRQSQVLQFYGNSKYNTTSYTHRVQYTQYQEYIILCTLGIVYSCQYS